MSKWKQRIISLFLVVTMIFGLAPATLMPVQAAAENLNQADGIVWLTKNEAGDSVSKEFESMVTSMKLDDMVREALDIQGSNDKVYFDGVDVGNAMDLFMNMGKVNALLDEMKAAITNHELVTFNIGSKDGTEKTIAFRNLTKESVTISAGEENIIYIDHPGAPVDADTLEGMINGALNNTVVSVRHNGVVQTTGFYTPNKTRFEATEFAAEGGASYKSLLRKWPTATVSPDSNVRKAGEVEVTIYAAEYSQKPDAKVTQTFEVYMRDQRVKVNAVAMNGETPVSDSELEGFTAEYSGNADIYPTEEPELKNYRFLRWEKGLYEGYDYTAIMEAKTDNNGNGLADQLEPAKEYTVKYYVEGMEEPYHTETVKEGGMPVGPTVVPECPYEEGEWEFSWVAENASWPAFVYDDINYYAHWTKIDSETTVEFEVTGVLLSDGKELRQKLSLVEYNVDNKQYTVADPGWASLVSGNYRCTGWYYKVAAGTGEDLNYDGFSDEARFYMDGHENETVLSAENDNVELFIEFLPVITVNKPVEDGSDVVYGDTDEIVVGGSTNVEIYYYTIETLDGPKYIQCTDAPANFDPADYGVVYDKKDSDRLYNFEGWDIVGSDSEYKVTPKLEIVENTIGIAEGISAFNPGIVKDADRVTYTIDGYKSEVSFDGGYVEGDFHTYALDAETEIVVSPFRNDTGEVLFYVKGLEAYKDGQIIAATENFDISYDAKYKATFKGVYDAIQAAASKRSVSAEKLSGVTLIPQYEPLRLKVKDGAKLLAGQTSEFYTEKYIYEEVTGAEYTDEVADAVSIKYRAQEDSYEVNLNKLFELLEADGLGALKEQIGDQYDSLTVIPPTGHNRIWESIGVIYADEITAQELTDEYLIAKYDEYKADSSMNILQFVGNVVEELGEVVYSGAHHKFGYVAPGESEPTEELRITYDSDKISASVEAMVKLEDTRIKTTITAKDVTCTYGENIREAIMKNVTLKAGNTELKLSDFASTLLVTYDAETNTVRNFSGIGADPNPYSVKVAFKGDTEYAPAISASAFKLTVKPVETKVTVEQLVTMEGNMFNKDVSAKVNNDAPIVQIIAGIATDELTFGVNTEGSVKDWALEFDDETMMLDVWVKLPQSYMDILSNVNIKDFYPESPIEKIEPGKEYTIEDLEKALEDEGLEDQAQIQSLEAILDQIPEVVKEKLGISDLTYGMTVRFDALEKKVYPTNSGFYLNYAATLSRFNNIQGTDIVVDKNHTASEDYGFIVISPMVPIPNRGGVQLYDGKVSNAQNVFVYEYDSDNVVERKLEVAVNNEKHKDEAPFYYGLTTRLDATKTAPSKPGVYFAGYNYTTEVKNTDSGEMEVKRLGSDSAIIVIKPEEANLTITGDIYEYEEGTKRFADVKITDKDGKEIQGAATVVSGTVNVKDDGTNVSANDLYGTINVDFPDTLQKKWDDYSQKYLGHKAPNEIVPSDLIKFLEKSRDAAKEAADKALDEFKTLAMKDAVSDVLDKINGKQNKVDVSSDNLVAKAERVQEMLNTSVAYYNKMLEQLEPLRGLDDNASLTFYDLEKEADKLPYDKKGYYLYLGVITDPELTVDAGKGLVIIHSEDDYVMYDTHVPYDGKAHGIEFDDNTCRDDVSVMVDCQANEITFFLDGDVYKAVNKALDNVPKLDASLNEGSDVTVSTIYTMTENVIDNVTKAIVDEIEATLIAKIKAKYPAGSEKLTNALNKVPGKVSNITERVTSKLEELDRLPNDTRIIFYNKDKATAEQGLPVDAGTYEFYGYDYDVSVTRGKLVIEPIYILVEDGIDPVTGEEIVVTKTDNEDDPDLRKYVSVTYHSFAGVAPAATTQLEVNLPTGVKEADVVEYVVTRTEANNRVVGTYDMSVTATLLADSRNYKLAERTEDVQDFKVVAEVGTITRGEWRMELDSVVYLNYYPTLNDFSENFDFADKSRAGVVIWTGDKAPTNGKYVVVDGENTMKIEGWMQNSKGEWYVQTPEIYAKNLGDMWYIRPYVVDKDGEYVYLNGVEYYSPKYFAYDVMNEVDRAEDEKYVCASLLQYGASAQIHFGYHDDKDNPLVNIIPARDINGRKYTNVSWDDYDLEYNEAYEDEIVITQDIIDLAGTLAIDEYYAKGITYNKSALDLAGAIRLSVGFEIDTTTIDPTQIKKQEVLFWNERDFENADTLAYSAATYNYKCDLVKATGNEEVNLGSYRGKSDHIVAKYLGEAVFFTCRIEMNDGTVYNSGLWYYSPEEFAADHIDESTGTVVDVSKRIIVYSEMAERCFIKNKK